jgi:hypothetical protein
MKTANRELKAYSRLLEAANRKQLQTLLLRLQPNAPASWGKMTAQQMLEHLIEQVQYTNGKKQPFCDVSEEAAKIAKQAYIYTTLEIPKNVVLGELPEKLIYRDIPTSVKQLMTELEDFDQSFNQPGTTEIHGGFGAMNYQEWLIWHGEHFTHHLTQFRLL